MTKPSGDQENRGPKAKTVLATKAERRISTLANTAAKKASKTEQRYDSKHTIISK